MDLDRGGALSAADADEGRTALLVRVWLPDRPGALGAVASRIGAVGGDVHEIEVVDRGAGRAIDELVVTVPDACPLDLLAREIDEIDGVELEDVESVPVIPADPRMQAFAAALDLAAAADRAQLARVLATHARREMRADFVAVVTGDDAQVVARSGGCPEHGWPSTFTRGVGPATESGGASSGRAEDLCWTVVPDRGWTLVTARASLALRDREQRVLQALADLAGLLLVRLDAA